MFDRSANAKRRFALACLAGIAIALISDVRATADEPTKKADANPPAAMPGADVIQDWGPAVGGKAVSITTGKATYAPGEQIMLGMHLKNLRNEEYRDLSWHNKDVFQISLSLPDGKPAPLTLYGKKWFSRRSSGVFGGTLKPGETRSLDIELSRLYDCTLEGKYTVTVNRTVMVPKDGKWEAAAAVSNKLEITVGESTPARAR